MWIKEFSIPWILILGNISDLPVTPESRSLSGTGVSEVWQFWCARGGGYLTGRRARPIFYSLYEFQLVTTHCYVIYTQKCLYVRILINKFVLHRCIEWWQQVCAFITTWFHRIVWDIPLCNSLPSRRNNDS